MKDDNDIEDEDEVKGGTHRATSAWTDDDMMCVLEAYVEYGPAWTLISKTTGWNCPECG